MLSMTLFIMLGKNSGVATERIEVQYRISQTSRMGKNCIRQQQTKKCVSISLSYTIHFLTLNENK